MDDYEQQLMDLAAALEAAEAVAWYEQHELDEARTILTAVMAVVGDGRE